MTGACLQVSSLWIFPKPLDRVIYSGLIYKLQQLRIDGSLLILLSSYLSGRRQIARINDSYSNTCYTKCGVPQGSVLGSLLFFSVCQRHCRIHWIFNLIVGWRHNLLFSSNCPLHLHQILTCDLYTLFNCNKRRCNFVVSLWGICLLGSAFILLRRFRLAPISISIVVSHSSDVRIAICYIKKYIYLYLVQLVKSMECKF